ncbi:hypothetical protein [Corynebacterium gerontici]|uniref:Uncharacterized protein n=1 Tax=Corynebacterium gerontici TaxID=2079234 RepID=A0A3G6J2T7_9CORY|nr:hypothetical protein [Corynebacterium gerontici]AZA12365.1 hypothetical protein CGERO_10425 [Corynebacterium gerontici]
MNKLNAAQLQGARNRITVSPDLIRRIATLLGYADLPATSSVAQLFDVTDALELLLIAQLGEMEISPTEAARSEARQAKEILDRIVSGQVKTRPEIHADLPSETVVLLRMGHPRLWGYAVRQRLPEDANLAVPKSFHRDTTGDYTDPLEAWMGVHITDAVNLSELETHSDEVPIDEDRYQRLRLGMSLADDYRQVWSSARGHWSISPDTTYLVPSRYGWCPYVYRVTDWRRDSFEGHRDRFMATRGYYIDLKNNRRIDLGAPDPKDAWLPTAELSQTPLTSRDIEVANAITNNVIALGPSQKNPVIRLRQKGRHLF